VPVLEKRTHYLGPRRTYDHGFRAGYASVKRFVLKVRGNTPAEARVVIATAPGEEAQVDYGEGPMVREPSTGEYRRTRLFVLTLGYSRKSVRLLVWRSSAQVRAELHEQVAARPKKVSRATPDPPPVLVWEVRANEKGDGNESNKGVG
jgi:transposase